MVKIGGRDDAMEHYLETVDEESDDPYTLMAQYFRRKASEKGGGPATMPDSAIEDVHDTNRSSMSDDTDYRRTLKQGLRKYAEEHGHPTDEDDVRAAVQAIEEKIDNGEYNEVETRFHRFAEEYGDGGDRRLIDVVQDGLEDIASHDSEHEYVRFDWGRENEG